MNTDGARHRATDPAGRSRRHFSGGAAVRHPDRNAGPARFYAQFPAGLSTLVTASLETNVKANLEFSDESSVVFTSRTPEQAIADLPYLKNVFQVLYVAPRRTLVATLDSFSAALAKGRLRLPHDANGRPFRLMASVDGQLVPLPKSARANLENQISRAARARVEARGMGEEYWIVGRRDLDSFLLARRVPRAAPKTQVPAGSLAPELSDLLIRMSRPNKDDRFLDPFGGSHALARARSRYPAASIISSDTATSREPDPGNPRQRVVVLREDARQLPSLQNGSVTAIVTDPPWDEFESVDDLRGFLAAMWASFTRVLTPRGSRVVVLMNRRGASLLLEGAREAGFHVVSSYDILVNGHPATATLFRPGPDQGPVSGQGYGLGRSPEDQGGSSGCPVGRSQWR